MGAETPLATRPPPTLWQRIQPPLLVVALLLIVWEIAARYGGYRPGTFAGPWETAQSIYELARDGSLRIALEQTVRRLLVAFLASLGIGAVLASLMVLLPPLRAGLQPLLLGLQSMPGLAWLPLSIVWFGYTENAMYFVTIIGSVFSITMGFVDAFSHVPPIFSRAARNMGLKGPALLFRVTVPAATPQLVTSAKVGWSFAWRSLVGAEILFPSLGGLGFLLDAGRAAFYIPQVLATMVIVLVVGIVFDRLLFANVERAVKRRWGLAER